MSGYAFHPDAVTDLEKLWEYIAERNLDAADRVIADIFDALRPSSHHRTSAVAGPT